MGFSLTRDAETRLTRFLEKEITKFVFWTWGTNYQKRT